MATMDRYRIKGVIDGQVQQDAGGGLITEMDLDLTNKVDLKNIIEKLTFEGDGKRIYKYISLGLEGEIAADTFDARIIAFIFNKTIVDSGLPVDEVKRMYFGDDTDAAGAVVGFAFTCSADRLNDDGTETGGIFVRVGIPRMTISPPSVPVGGNVAKSPLVFQISAERTTTDIAGNTLPGGDVGDNGVTAWLAELA